jgi:pantothenate kinase-related protein Tda10
MEITKETKVSAILQEYGDIADVMEVFGVKRVGRYSLRRMITKALTVENAARVHRVSLDEFMETLTSAVQMQHQKRGAAGELTNKS